MDARAALPLSHKGACLGSLSAVGGRQPQAHKQAQTAQGCLQAEQRPAEGRAGARQGPRRGAGRGPTARKIVKISVHYCDAGTISREAASRTRLQPVKISEGIWLEGPAPSSRRPPQSRPGRTRRASRSPASRPSAAGGAGRGGGCLQLLAALRLRQWGRTLLVYCQEAERDATQERGAAQGGVGDWRAGCGGQAACRGAQAGRRAARALLRPAPSLTPLPSLPSAHLAAQELAIRLLAAVHDALDDLGAEGVRDAGGGGAAGSAQQDTARASLGAASSSRGGEAEGRHCTRKLPRERGEYREGGREGGRGSKERAEGGTEGREQEGVAKCGEGIIPHRQPRQCRVEIVPRLGCDVAGFQGPGPVGGAGPKFGYPAVRACGAAPAGGVQASRRRCPDRACAPGTA